MIVPSCGCSQSSPSITKYHQNYLSNKYSLHKVLLKRSLFKMASMRIIIVTCSDFHHDGAIHGCVALSVLIIYNECKQGQTIIDIDEKRIGFLVLLFWTLKASLY